jgi:hypothetical protein
MTEVARGNSLAVLIKFYKPHYARLYHVVQCGEEVLRNGDCHHNRTDANADDDCGKEGNHPA